MPKTTNTKKCSSIEQDVLIFALSNSKELGEKIATILNTELSPIDIACFADGEVLIKPKISVRHRRVVLIQSTSKPVNDALMELLIAIDAMRRASAKSVNVIIPYFGYARQDRKASPREPISARLVAKLIEAAGANSVLTYDIHSNQQQGFYDIPFDTLQGAWSLFKQYSRDNHDDLSNVVVVAPDYGSVKRSREISMATNTGLAIVDKRRCGMNQIQINNILGEVKGKDCVLIDDMIDTGGTILGAAQLVHDKGAASVTIMATHGLFNNNALQRIQKAIENKVINAVYITDTIKNPTYPWLKVVSVANSLSECIRIYSQNDGSMSMIHDLNSKLLFEDIVETVCLNAQKYDQ
ncbi:ribose-phosphate diphosphokinase [Ureaplasma zalophigenitalium]|uniref:Ribose-phosphate pyrophosphokinase n=1 Tax=Ureaplasma zalophigenitalium TaxID=907723 RepID=A0ABT3BPX9_9BACT|nr:ribose-phosphate pyrophosphokinase [Ureaplasma zalophigenitalium]MCV3754282.1 ribose-phosphate pyrophosphokinase [Ureaplasma zalophigenitalium]